MCVMSVSGSNAARVFSSSRKSTDRKSMWRPLGGLGLWRETPTTSQPHGKKLLDRGTPQKAACTRDQHPVWSVFGRLIIQNTAVDQKVYSSKPPYADAALASSQFVMLAAASQ
jgi:hypothetical protein